MLKGMIIEHFRGITYQEVDFEKITEILGTNQSGKSTVAAAFFWGCDGKDEKNRSNYDIRHRQRPENDPRVTLDFGSIKLRKTYKSGKAGNTILYQVDKGLGFDTINMNDCEVKGDHIKGYNTYIDEMFPMFRMCADIFYFAQVMETEEARKFVLARGCNPDQEEILALLSEETNEILKKIFQVYGPNEAMRSMKSRKKEIEEEIKKLNGEIEGREKDIDATIPETKRADLEASLKNTEKRIADLQERLKEISVSADLYEKIQAAKDEKRNAENLINEENHRKDQEWNKICNEKNTAYQAACRAEDEVYFNLKRDHENKEKQYLKFLARKSEIPALEEKKDKYLKAIEEAKEKEFKEIPYKGFDFVPGKFSQDEKCSKCGKPVTPDEMKAYRKSFDEEESKRIDQHNALELRRKEAHEESQSQMRDLFEESQSKFISEINDKIDAIDLEISEINKMNFPGLENELEEHRKNAPRKAEIIKPILPNRPAKINFDPEPYDRKIIEAQNQLKTQKDTIEERQKPIHEEIETEKGIMKGIMEHIAKHDSAETMLKMLKNSKDLFIAKNEMKDDLKKKIAAITEYNRALSGIARAKTKEVFGVEIELYRELISEELKEDFIVLCETEQGLVPFSVANTASQIKTGMIIVKKMQEMFNSHPPVFIDNCESVVENFPEMNLQQIIFITAKKLRKIKTRFFQSVQEYNEKRNEIITEN